MAAGEKEKLAALKIELRESQSPYFSEEELLYYLKKNNYDLSDTIYECAILKSEDDSIQLPGGLSIPDNKKYWLRIATKNRKVTTGVR